MPSTPKDFRSDTVTRPTPAMRAAMAAADVGDDVWGEDPTVIELQDRVAELLGKEAALFVPSGTMSNLIGVRVHCRPGEAMICEAESHVYYYEQGGYAQINGVTARPLQGQNGVLRVEQLEALPEHDDPHFPADPSALPGEHAQSRRRTDPALRQRGSALGRARRRGLRTHLDGARLWNAAVASGIPPARWSQHFDTVNVASARVSCAGGLGPGWSSRLDPRGPASSQGSGRRDATGRRSGRGGLYALDHHVDRLAEDHANARNWRGPASKPRRAGGAGDDRHDLVYSHLDAGPIDAVDLSARLRGRCILMHETGPRSIARSPISM